MEHVFSVKSFVGDLISKSEVAVDLDEIQADWELSTDGEMDEVTVNLAMLFDDFREMLGIPRRVEIE